MEALRVEKLVFGYQPDKPVLIDVDFKAEYSTIIAVLGPNGAGKSTLLKLLLGAYKPWRGRIFVEGRDLYKIDIRERAKIFSWVPQESPNIPLSVYEYVLLGRVPHVGFLSQPSRSDTRIVEAVLESLGLKWAMNRPIQSLSGGEKQLVLIAKALVQESKIMLLDEPTSHLDLGNKIRVLKTIRSLREQGLLVIYTTHDPNEALLIADKTMIIHRGRIESFGDTKDILDTETLSKIYGIDLEQIDIDNRTYILPKL